jgi:Zn ribbon nucleic-acid-binding protein
MITVLYYQEVRECDICPKCKGLLSHGIFNENHKYMESICLKCGYRCKVKISSVKAKKKRKK